MPRSFLRERVCRFHRSRLLARAERISEADLAAPAVVFSPHPDDETLGCGGTILRKTRAGASVAVVIMTDGRRSHGHLMPAEELVDLRMAEAQAAADKLGVASEDVIFLGLEDGRLADQLDAAVPKVAEVLARCRPDQVFLPYRHEPPEDHAAAYHAVSKALSSHDRPVTAYEYPVWFWCHWPWATWPWFRRRQVVRRWGHGITSTIRLRRDFRIVVNIRDVLPAKREAMACYRTQMTQVLPGVGWRTFDDVSDGEFLDCCFQEHEFFMRYTS